MAPPLSAGDPDAGLRPHDHYKIRLPKWRYSLRQKLLPLIRWETPYLAAIQESLRSDPLDTYFAITANLGTHTFFMIFLPICFWLGYTEFGRGLVHVLASGVFFSGFMKDFFCLPRPLSPPLHRITMSGSAALEYGFPSTHSTNAVSVALYSLLVLRDNPSIPDNQRIIYIVLAALYATSIVFGRVYCGMHGFLDVVVGSILGVILALAEWVYGPLTNQWVWYGTWVAPVTMTLAILMFVRIHPEPADPCPCFDDGVAFAGVVVGIEVGQWHYSKTSFGWNTPVPATVPYSFQSVGLVSTSLRFVMGVAIIFIWREVAKSVLLRYLPPLFRFIGRIGLVLPRRHFIDAREYKSVPSHLPDETIPPIGQLPRMIRRGRSDSVGPQSAADAYETLAFRERKRRESLGQEGMSPGSRSPVRSPLGQENGNNNVNNSLGGYVQQQQQQRLKEEEEEKASEETYEKQERDMLSQIEKPRVRYDVEVVTKLLVYSGIAWWAVEGTPILFELVGLGAGQPGADK
ncbi:hypothetical protein TWF569_011192 [Orbilia oligospora]|uniref:Uncharacterized protein n=2 Tax=Orbilia oligospora TaxID=2813651 RepID=A0A7C8PVB2_ORBOL|nr:hypothetical protein TWF569_011192 [Orbilia oligospora]KAF3180912.1 hypothetical protein TWF751_010134 [Orbilia oligospora]KAF3193651.1 hypothetical protein TWF225_009213 [Orbilia oligospora]KAF3269838.1 hypothetical protein TWF217_008197 [Orbilia oligospora]KAF3270293.1 hypothetical protein TWF128_004088 [Orbilia oligospora]